MLTADPRLAQTAASRDSSSDTHQTEHLSCTSRFSCCWCRRCRYAAAAAAALLIIPQDAREAGEDDIEAILAEILNKEAKQTAVSNQLSRQQCTEL